ncbi:L-rhamnono-gamma-lactonase [Recurvomyces mirabilis]|uniref:L-rhamnono-gamma-lactonase n=1 Tax=Recurvomyces mirabilis TaxID=574656 RepID=UPI002DE1CC77|nr:L-rhamnono-gamma-lactonase [Recurvomyces mirabilis]
MAPRKIIDSHIHLWPKETSNETGHAWMTPPDMALAKPHLLKDYFAVADGHQDVEVQGVIYVETDVRYDAPNGDVASWAKGPLDEISFLRATVEGKYDVRDKYLALAEERAGPQVWERVKGFRFLLQFISDQAVFGRLVLGQDFQDNLKLLGKRGFSFDVGVDQHRAGTWQLTLMAKAVEMAHAGVPIEEKVTFILNHLCKPDYGETKWTSGKDSLSRRAFTAWCDAIELLAKQDETYMKLSGQFSEMPSTQGTLRDLADTCHPWIEHVLKCFGPKRVMFGSDWPVCNVSGPSGEKSWVVWRGFVEASLDGPEHALSNEDLDWIWHKTATEAYRLR